MSCHEALPSQAVIARLAKGLAKRFGRGFGRRNVFVRRAFYLAGPGRPALRTHGPVTQRCALQWLKVPALVEIVAGKIPPVDNHGIAIFVRAAPLHVEVLAPILSRTNCTGIRNRLKGRHQAPEGKSGGFQTGIGGIENTNGMRPGKAGERNLKWTPKMGPGAKV